MTCRAMRDGKVERLSRRPYLQVCGRRGTVIPEAAVETTAQRGHLAHQRAGAQRGAHPTHVGLGHNPDEGFFGQRLEHVARIQYDDQGLVRIEMRLCLGERKRGWTGETRIVLEVRAEPSIDFR